MLQVCLFEYLISVQVKTDKTRELIKMICGLHCNRVSHMTQSDATLYNDDLNRKASHRVSITIKCIVQQSTQNSFGHNKTNTTARKWRTQFCYLVAFRAFVVHLVYIHQTPNSML